MIYLCIAAGLIIVVAVYGFAMICSDMDDYN